VTVNVCVAPVTSAADVPTVTPALHAAVNDRTDSGPSRHATAFSAACSAAAVM
jgi:hypothetical protein